MPDDELTRSAARAIQMRTKLNQCQEELATSYAKGYRDALEAAAKVCEERAAHMRDCYEDHMKHNFPNLAVLADAAAKQAAVLALDLRALAPKETPT